MDLNQVLVPVDFSDASSQAVERGAELAKKCGGKLRLVHACDVPPYVYSDCRTMMVSGVSFQEYTADAVREKLTKLEEETAASHELAVSSIVRDGPAGREVCSEAEASGCDLILVPTHARTGVSRLLLGSVAEKIVRHANCPVLTFQAGENALDFSTMRKILIPLDLSDTANQSVDYAVAWAQFFDGGIELIHVLEDVASIPSMEWNVHPAAMPEEYYRAAEKRVSNSMEAAAAAEIQCAVPHECSVRYGFVAEEIVKAAVEHDIDLIITSTHGHSGLRKVLLGSVAERLVRTAPCPVVTFRPNE